MRKSNRSYEKKTVRRLNGMIKKLHNMSDKVTEELYWGKHWQQDLHEKNLAKKEEMRK